MSLSELSIKKLFPNISESCKICNTCCKTYGWLLEEEAKKFVIRGYQIIKLNDSLFCIDSFKRDTKGNLILNEIPRCRFYWEKECLIQKDKPLDCRLFPIKIKFYQDSCVLGLSLGCKYIFNLNKKEKNEIYRRVIQFIKEMPKKELNEYLNLMQEIHLISKPKRFWMKKLIKFEKEEAYWNIINLFP